MANRPQANTRVRDNAGAIAGGLDLVCVLAPVKNNADMKPRLFGSADAISSLHGYSEGLEYCDLHATRTRKPVLFVGLPIATEGTIGRVNKSGNTNTSIASVTAAVGGVLHEHDGAVRVVKGGVVGTDQIVLEWSRNGGRKWKKFRLGTATSYTFPLIGAVLSLAAGSLTAGDTIITWHGTGPRADMGSVTTARQNLAKQTKLFRSMVLIQDLQDSDDAATYRDELEAYETENQRFIYGRSNIVDRLPYAEMSHDIVRMQGNPNLTFAEVGATSDTITRSAGSWIADGFAVGMTIKVTGSASNNIEGVIAAISATVITLGTTDLAAEGPVGNVTVVGRPTLTFAEVGATGDTLTRSHGSWVADGFRPGDLVVITGTASNNITAVVGLTAVTPTVLTFDTTDLAAEVISTENVSVTAGQTKAQWMATMDAEFAAINGERIDISAGRALGYSGYSQWHIRMPAMWFLSCREYQHDLHIPNWRKADGDLACDLNDADGVLIEWDDRADGGAASAARFSSLTTWANGPEGTFATQSLTRADEGSPLSKTHNAAVTNLACTVNQLNTELIIGQSLILDAQGHATAASLSVQKQKIDKALKSALLTDLNNEGPRASVAYWTPSQDDDFTVPEPTLTGVLTLILNGTVFNVDTVVNIGAAA